MSHDIEDGRNLSEAEEAWNNYGIEFTEDSNTYRLMRALLSYADEYDDRMEDVYAAHHINSATGEALDRFGELVQLDRKDGEGDDKYRSRLQVQFRVGNIGTTFDEFAEFAAAVFDTTVDDIEFRFPLEADPATIRVSIDESIYEDATLTAEEASSFLGRAVPAGHEVEALQSGSLRLKSDGETDTASRGLTSDSISDGGTLAEDAA